MARKDYGLGGAVQHGASTLPPEAFDAFPRPAPARSTSRPTSRTWSTSTRSSRPTSRPRCTPGCASTRTEERKPKDTEEQFIYKARKKAIGPFKQQMWSLGRRRAPRDRPVARGAVRVPDEAAEHRRHRRRRDEVRQGAGGHAQPRSRARRRRRARSPRPRGRQKGWRTRRRRFVGSGFRVLGSRLGSRFRVRSGFQVRSGSGRFRVLPFDCRTRNLEPGTSEPWNVERTRHPGTQPGTQNPEPGTRSPHRVTPSRNSP